MTDIINRDYFKKSYVGLIKSKKKWTPPEGSPDINLTAYIEFRDSPEKLEEISNALLAIGIGSTLANKGKCLRVQGIKYCVILAPYTNVQWFKEVMELCSQDMHKTKEGLRHILLMYPKDSKTRKKKNQTDISEVLNS